MAVCRLCRNERELRNSHIVPEFLYSDLYNVKGHMMGINGYGRRGWKPLQMGIREPLFCESCEQHFNEYCEKPFRAQWVESPPLPNPWKATDVYWIKVDYEPFKLFHLSVLFRAGVSSLPTFSAVSLGPHEERLRKLILNRNVGNNWQYPIFAYAVVHHRTNEIVQMVSAAKTARFGGRCCYGMMYGGAEWWICVASDRNVEFERGALRPDGKMPFIAMPWNEITSVQEASIALNQRGQA